MRFRCVLSFVGVACVSLIVGSAGATPVFVDFDAMDHHEWVTDQYAAQGIIFEQTQALAEWVTAYAPVKYAGDHIAFSDGYDISTFHFAHPVNEFSLLVTANAEDLTLTAYDSSDNQIATYTETIYMGDWHEMTLDLTGLCASRIVIHNEGLFFGFDNVTASVIPEPTSLVLLGLGLAGFAVIRRRIRK